MAQKILIVDDSKAMRLIVRRTLRQAGFGDWEVEEATNGAEALAVIEQNAPFLVISDWNMPEMTGYELLQKIKEKNLHVKCGMVTTESTPQMRALAADAGSLFLIAKPFTPEQFQAVLQPILG